MITDEQIDELPTDPDAEFVAYEAIIRESVRRLNDSREGNRGWDIEREYVAHILAFVDARKLFLELPKDPPADDEQFSFWYQDFLRAVDYFKAHARLVLSDRKRSNVAVLALSPDLKTQIGAHITAIRKIVHEGDLPENKKDRIYSRLSNLQKEVDQDRTRTEAAMALILEITQVAGQAADNLDPVFKRVESIIRVLAKAKAENEQKALEVPSERKRLSAPTLPATQEKSTLEPNDDIPF